MNFELFIIIIIYKLDSEINQMASYEQIEIVLDLAEDYWEEPGDDGQTGETHFKGFMQKHRKFFEGTFDEGEEEEDEDEFEDRLAELWQEYKAMHENLLIKMVSESDLSVQTIFKALEQEIEEDPQVPFYAKALFAISDLKIFEDITFKYPFE